LRGDPAAFGQQHALAEREHLRGEADVNGQLQQQPVAVRPDVGDRAAEPTQQRLDGPEGILRPAGHDRESAVLGGGDAAGDRGVEHAGP
jgi:hypothetical protein